MVPQAKTHRKSVKRSADRSPRFASSRIFFLLHVKHQSNHRCKTPYVKQINHSQSYRMSRYRTTIFALCTQHGLHPTRLCLLKTSLFQTERWKSGDKCDTRDSEESPWHARQRRQPCRFRHYNLQRACVTSHVLACTVQTTHHSRSKAFALKVRAMSWTVVLSCRTSWARTDL